jgi:protein-L-isoaspartate(D-aspartate) O-methyltransferase
MIAFFNANRRPVGRQRIGPWSGSFEWTQSRLKIKVPTSARLASVEVGLWGATGQISVADVTLKVIASSRLAEQHGGPRD